MGDGTVGRDRPPGNGRAGDRRTGRRRAGDAAEAVAARLLESAGLVVLARQWTRRVGELDLVAVEPGPGTIVFVEVRYRAAGVAVETVGAAKRRRLRSAAAAWLQRHADPRRPARIDVIGLAPARPHDAAPAGATLREGYLITWLADAASD